MNDLSRCVQQAAQLEGDLQRVGLVCAIQQSRRRTLRAAHAAPPPVDLTGTPVLILSGAMDPIVPADNAARLAALLTQAGAAVQHQTLPTGHGLSQADVTLTRAWLDQL